MSVRGEGSGRTALITGASAGIGLALARAFAARGFDLVLTARREERLAALTKELRDTFGIAVRVMPADLARPETPVNLCKALEEESVTIDALVNNAGYAVAGRYHATSWDEQRDCLQVLVTAPLELTHRLLPGMTSRGYGRVLNVASVAGLMPGFASATLYGGAKAMLIKVSQALHSEQRASGVFVTALCPGFTDSEFHAPDGSRGAMRRIPNFMWLSAARVAEAGYRAVMRNQAVCIPGVQYKIATALVRLLLPLNGSHRLGELRARIVETIR